MDTTNIEQKALTKFLEYLEDSKVLSSRLAQNDKTPLLDGALYLYKVTANDNKSNKDVIGQVNVQIKGRVVDKFIEDNFCYRISTNDLKFYLLHPVLFIVCQEKNKEKQLYYKAITPEDAKRILSSHKDKESASVLMTKMPDKLEEFEQIVLLFHDNCALQGSFAKHNPFTMADARRVGFKKFTILAPQNMKSETQIMKYLSEHSVCLYAKRDNDFDAVIPINDAFGKIIFRTTVDTPIFIGEHKFYDQCLTEIKNGRRLIHIGRCITFDTSMVEDDLRPSRINYKNNVKFLDESIEEAEVLLALYKEQKFTIGSTEVELSMPLNDSIRGIQERLPQWKKIQALFNVMHIHKPLDLTILSEEDEQKLSLFISCLYDKQSFKMKDIAIIPYLWDFQGINILVQCNKDEQDNIYITNFFESDVMNRGFLNLSDDLWLSPYSYLSAQNLWDQVDNIDYEQILPFEQNMITTEEDKWQVINYDISAMIAAAFKVQVSDVEKNKKLLKAAREMSDWAYDIAREDYKEVYFLNKLIMEKHNSQLTSEHAEYLQNLVALPNTESYSKIIAYALLADKENFMEIYNKQTMENKKNILLHPIGTIVLDNGWKIEN